MYDRVGEAVFVLFRAFILYGIFHITRQQSKNSKCHPLIAVAWAIGVPAALAFMSWAKYGTHTEDSDPLFGGGYTVQDFVASENERDAHGLFMFILIVAPTLLGLFYGLKERFENEARS